MGALDGIRVVDLSRYLSGPTLTMLLADLGADVVKVESLPGGDPARESGPFHGSESVYYMASNRNKRSVALDLRAPEGRAALDRLLADADVFVQNFKPGTAEKMGLGVDELRAVNPKLVYVSISGFGSAPPGSDLPGFDQTAQAMSGIMSVTGTEETGPMRVGAAISDSATGIYGAVGVLAALVERGRTGLGRHVETSLMQASLSLCSYQAQKYLSLKEIAEPVGNDHPIMFPQGTFRTGHGSITLASGNEKMWRRLCAVIGLSDIAEDPRFSDNAGRMQHRKELRKLIEAALAERPSQEWVPLINEVGVPCGPVLDLEQALLHPITAGLRMVESVEHSLLGEMQVMGQAVTVEGSEEDWLHTAPPRLGEHTRQVLLEVGYDDEQIDLLESAGTVRTGAHSDVATGAM